MLICVLFNVPCALLYFRFLDIPVGIRHMTRKYVICGFFLWYSGRIVAGKRGGGFVCGPGIL
jgi:hypothetical protein